MSSLSSSMRLSTLGFHVKWSLSFLLLAALFRIPTGVAEDLRIGIIGCDTSHSVAFTEVLNNSSAKGHVAGGKVVAAYKGGSRDIESSWSRVEQYTKTLQEKYGVKFYDSIEDMCRNVDAVLLESVDGRPHLEQARPVIASHKPVFIDKPMARSLKDVLEIFRLAKKAKVPVFSSSALRYGKDTQVVAHGSIGKVNYVETYGPCEIEPHHPDLFWYGVHGVEALYTIMGPGCVTVQRGTTPQGKIEVAGTWRGGRKGVYREDKEFHGVAKSEKTDVPVGSFNGYEPLVAEIMKFFKTGIAPVDPKETIEIFAFMEAADRSKANGGAAVKIKDVLR
jgi:GFO/IDH/MocA oxidoreductase family protein